MPLWHLLLAAVSVPTGVSSAPQTMISAMPKEVLGETVGPDEMLGAVAVTRAMEQQDAAATSGELDRALQLLPRPTRLRGKVQCWRAYYGLAAAQDDEAAIATARKTVRPMVAECFRLLPDDAYAIKMEAAARYAENDLRAAAKLLIRVVEMEGPRAVEDSAIDTDSFMRSLAYARLYQERDELTIALAKAGEGRDNPARFSGQMFELILRRLSAGDRAGALALLPNVLKPDTGLMLLIDRRFKSIWPEVEEWAGRNLEAQRVAYVAAAKAQFELDPNMITRRVYADALVETGEKEKGEKLLADALADPSLWDDSRYEAGATATHYAAWLANDGRAAAAVAALTRFEVQTPKDKYSSVINVMPNKVLILLRMRRYAEALQVLDTQTPKIEQVESPGVMSYFTAMRSCALLGLGRTREAADLRESVLNGPVHNNQARDFAARCTGDKSLLVTRWLDRLTRVRSDALMDYLVARQSDLPDFMANDATIVALRSIMDEPAVRDTFAIMGRELPSSFAPALRHWAPAGLSHQ